MKFATKHQNDVGNYNLLKKTFFFFITFDYIYFKFNKICVHGQKFVIKPSYIQYCKRFLKAMRDTVLST